MGVPKRHRQGLVPEYLPDQLQVASLSKNRGRRVMAERVRANLPRQARTAAEPMERGECREARQRAPVEVGEQEVFELAAHKAPAVHAWVAKHPRVHLQYTPTYSSWRNQVELWFSKLERDCIERGIFTSIQDLKRKLLAYINRHNTEAKPFLWTYDNPKRRIRVTHQ